MTKHLWHGDPNIAVHLHEIGHLLDCMGPDHQNDARVKACRNWKDEADAYIRRRNFPLLLIGKYDAVWAVLNRVRNELCAILPASGLQWVVQNVRAGLCYLSPAEAGRSEKELAGIEKSLREVTTAPHGHTEEVRTATATTLACARFDLERLSRLVADAREAHWRKVNLLRGRLLLTALALLILVLPCIWLLPAIPTMQVTEIQVLGVILFGALGGSVSALRTKESLAANAPVYYIQRTLLLLKPVVGAATALFVYLAQLAGVLKVVPTDVNPAGAQLVLAFIAGLSGRFLVDRVSQIAGHLESEEKKEKKNGGEPATE
ncbi:MAG TPA: hypothetical protein VHI13_18270 [Candidatus Kapabacteria bacterium]|nr:hypothetical protein [Candidatus Kapabacteria bacterium]